jgi:hypothetical protein
MHTFPNPKSIPIEGELYSLLLSFGFRREELLSRLPDELWRLLHRANYKMDPPIRSTRVSPRDDVREVANLLHPLTLAGADDKIEWRFNTEEYNGGKWMLSERGYYAIGAMYYLSRQGQGPTYGVRLFEIEWRPAKKRKRK